MLCGHRPLQHGTGLIGTILARLRPVVASMRSRIRRNAFAIIDNKKIVFILLVPESPCLCDLRSKLVFIKCRREHSFVLWEILNEKLSFCDCRVVLRTFRRMQ